MYFATTLEVNSYGQWKKRLMICMHVNIKGRTPPVCVLSLTCNLVSQRGGNKLRIARNTKLREGERGRQKKSTIRSFIICIARQILLGWSNEGQLERWGMGHLEAEQKCTSFVVEKTWRKQTTKRTWCTFYNIKMYIKGTWWEGLDWVNLAHDRGKLGAVVNRVMKYPGVQNAGNYLTVTTSPMTRTLLYWVSCLGYWCIFHIWYTD